MSEEEIKQKLVDNGFENLIPIFEENHLLDVHTISAMTDSDYQSIGVSVLGDRKKLLYIFQKSEDSEQKKEEDEFINIERDGKEFCYKKSEPGILLCRECHHRVFEEATLCSNCNNSLVHSKENSSVQNSYNYSVNSYPQTDNYYREKPKSSIKAKLPIIIIAIIVAMGFFGLKSVNKSNYVAKLDNVYSKIKKSSSDAELCITLIHTVWYNAIFDKQTTETTKYTAGTKDFNEALKKVFSDSNFKYVINEIKKDSVEINGLMKKMTNPPSDYKDAYVKLNSAYEDYVKLIAMAQSPSGSLTTYTQTFNSLDTALASELKSLELYLK